MNNKIVFLFLFFSQMVSALFASEGISVGDIQVNGDWLVTGDSGVVVYAASNKDEMIYHNTKPVHFRFSCQQESSKWMINQEPFLMPVKTLRSDVGVYNPTFHKLLKHRKFPNVRIKMQQLVFNSDGKGIMDVEIEMAGYSRTEQFVVKWSEGSNETEVTLSGIVNTHLTDYQLDPPVLLFGSIRVKDEVRLEFDFILKRTSL